MRHFPFLISALLVALIILLLVPSRSWAVDSCAESAVALQVLGSGGPIADDARSSSGYLIWVNGKARVMIDVGSGTFTRFGQAEARFADLDLIALSHFHTDHAAALPALLKSGYFSPRTRALAIAGPAGAGPFPSLEEFLSRLLDRERGAFGYLAGYLDGSAGLVALKPTTTVEDAGQPTPVYRNDDIQVVGLSVPHGIVPSVAYAVTAKGKTMVLGSDQTTVTAAFSRLAKGADLLLLHAVIPQDAGRAARALHAVPSQLAAVAAAAKPGQLVLSHWMARSLEVQDDILATVRGAYDGPITLATDLACFPLATRADVQ
ncbi:MAG: MBL fold metallo-hydrolase [Lysobacterales bacterium]